ncbi:MAG: caspase family protein [Myxococcota bacterium]
MSSIACLLTLLGILAGQPASAQTKAPMRRFGLVISANDGGAGRSKLRYAESDAASFGSLLKSLGGVEDGDRINLAQPAQADIERGFQEIQRAVEAARPSTERVELIFYYSGHSDENGLLLGDYNVPYGELRAKLEAVPADVRIAILDSCASGAMTRAKGGQRRPPFLVDQASQVRGYAVLASSSESEAAQESDRVGASYFTNSLITGLRGAADVSKDGRVTLSEAYQFAFADTLERTSQTLQGPQHPTYDLQLVGSGDLVITDLRGTSAALFFPEPLEGKIWVRDHSGRLVAELVKHQGDPIELGLEPGEYEVLYDRGGQRRGGPVRLAEGGRTSLAVDQLLPIGLERTKLRGNQAEMHFLPVDVALVTPIAVASALDGPVEVGFSLSLLMGKNTRLTGLALSSGLSLLDEQATGLQITAAGAMAMDAVKGLQIAGALDWAGTTMSGLQISGAFNYVGEALFGAQISGGLNVAGASSSGLQLTGGLNLARDLVGAQVGVLGMAEELRGAQISVVNIGGHVKGLQLGVLNYSEENEGVALGVLSYARKNGILSPTIFSSETALVAGGLKIGNAYTYSIVAVGGVTSSNSSAWSLGLGWGGRFRPTDALYLDLDGIVWNVCVGKDIEHSNLITSARLTLGYRFNDLVSIYAGPTFNVLVDVGDINVQNLAPSWAAHPGNRVWLWPSATVGVALN